MPLVAFLLESERWTEQPIRQCLLTLRFSQNLLCLLVKLVLLVQVYDTFGPVSSPFYVVSFEDGSAIPPNLALNQEVLYAPNVDSLTSFVFMAQLRK